MPAPQVISFSLEFDIGEPSAWWKDGSIGTALANALAEADLWLDFRFCGTAGGNLKPLRDPDDLEAFARKWRPTEYVLQQQATYDADATAVRLSVREDSFSVDVRLVGEDVETRTANVLASLASFGIAFFPALASFAMLTSGSTLLAEPYPRPRPPRVATSAFVPGSILDLFDVNALRAHASQRDVEAILKAPLPRGVARRRVGRLVVIRWADDLRDAAAVAAARTRQEQWLLAHVDLDRDTRYDERGDLRENASGATPHPPLTAYDGRIAVGYKAVVPPAMDAEQWAEIEGWVKRGKLPDGSPLQSLRLIVPKRDLALEVHDRALRAGADAVLYTDNEGRWWNPFPPGPWVEAPSRKRR